MLATSTTTSTTSTTKKYDPMYCLSEHLEYFNKSVAGKQNLLKVDFDEIFGSVPMTTLQSVSSDTIVPIRRDTPDVVPPSPTKKATFTLSMKVEPTILPKPAKVDREQAVVSPTTVTSTDVFSPATVTSATEQVKKIQKPKTMSRKRKISDESAPEDSMAPIDPNDKEHIRRERNRQHAKRSRQRKREFMSALEDSVQALKDENATLFQILGLSTQADAHIVSERQSEMDVTANENFIEALRQPQNRVLSDDALASLRELF